MHAHVARCPDRNPEPYAIHPSLPRRRGGIARPGNHGAACCGSVRRCSHGDGIRDATPRSGRDRQCDDRKRTRPCRPANVCVRRYGCNRNHENVAGHRDASAKSDGGASRHAVHIDRQRSPHETRLSRARSTRTTLTANSLTRTSTRPTTREWGFHPLPLEGVVPSPEGLETFHRDTAAGWSSPVARLAHNQKVVGSNPTPAIETPIARDADRLMTNSRA